MTLTLNQWIEFIQNRPWFLDDSNGPKRIKAVMEQLIPKIDIPIITVGGTNGKGSTTALLEAIYSAQGYQVGCFTSPHLFEFNERIRINQQPIDDVSLCEAFAVIAAKGGDNLRYFDYTFIAAMLIFCQHNLDLIILEVGLGGMHDATNAIDATLAIITSIDLDHTDRLGHTRELIAEQKAGIFRQQQLIVIGEENPPQVLLDKAQTLSKQNKLINRDFSLSNHSAGYIFVNKKLELHLPHVNVIASNLACAIETVCLMQSYLKVEQQTLINALANFKQLGRLQLCHHKNQNVLYDVAHNPAATRQLAALIKKDFPDKPIHAIFSMHEDKAIIECINIMSPLVKQWHVAPLNLVKGASNMQLKSCFEQSMCKSSQVSFYQNIHQAVEFISNYNEDVLFICFGSFQLVASVYRINLDIN